MNTTVFSSKYREKKASSKLGPEQPAVIDFYRREVRETRDFVAGLVESSRRGAVVGRVSLPGASGVGQTGRKK